MDFALKKLLYLMTLISNFYFDELSSIPNYDQQIITGINKSTFSAEPIL